MAKPTRIADVSEPGQIAADPSSRPIVTNHALLAADPMMVTKDDSQTAATSVTRTARSIAPPEPATESLAAPAAVTPPAETEAVTPTEVAVLSPPPVATPEPAARPVIADIVPAERDSEAELAATETQAEEVQAARQEQLETLIASGEFAVPINAVGRGRSHMHTVVLVFVVLVLVVVLADALLDANVVKLSTPVPHTHFFSK